MGDFDLRPPSLGDSLPRARTPHLVDPEELRLRGPGPAPRGYSPPGGPRVDPADVMRAVGHYAEETPAPGPLSTPRPAPVPPAVRFSADSSGDGRTSAVGTASAEVGSEEGSHVRGTAGLSATRDDAGTTAVEGTAGGELHVEHGGVEGSVEGTARGLGTGTPSGSVEGRMSASGRDIASTTDVAVEGIGTDEVEGSLGTAVRVGSETGLRGEGAVRATGLGSEEPTVMGSATVHHGEHRPSYGVSLGVVGGEHPHSRLGTSFSVSPSEGNSLSLSGTLDGAETSSPSGSLSAEARARLARDLELRANLGLDGITPDGHDLSGRAGLGLNYTFAPGWTVGGEVRGTAGPDGLGFDARGTLGFTVPEARERLPDPAELEREDD